MITLTPDERRKFAEWLRQEAHTNKLLIEQIKTLAMPKAITDNMIRMYEMRMGASLSIAAELEAVEAQTIRG